MSAADNIDVIVESAQWDALPDAQAVARNAIAQALAALNGRADAELAVLLTDDAAVRRLNATWRGLDKPTNVLSFPAAEAPEPHHLGDIAIAFETTAREAKDEGKPLADHLAHLAVHGFLHLVGYDHESDADAETMEQLERDILARLNVPDPYLAPISAEATGV
ncbi:MAG: putative rRNA maturation factor [Hyphomicrobiales bacterium]|jgi:probable rRNA maturation factor